MLSLPKLLVIALVIGAIYYLFFRKPSKAADNSGAANGKKEDKKLDDVMVECAKCGTFVSSKEAIIKDGRYYCSKECAAL